MLELSDIRVETADGEEVRIGELVDRPTVLVLPRYYGCLPCRDYLRTLADHGAEIGAAGGGVISVSTGTDYQARWLVEKYGFAFPLLVDPERNLFDALALDRKLSVALRPSGLANYARAIFRGNRQGKITEPLQMPGLAILDADARATRVHRGEALGDYPPVETTLAWLREAAGTHAPARSA